MATIKTDDHHPADPMIDISPHQLDLPLQGTVYCWSIEGEDFAKIIRDARVSFRPGSNITFRVTSKQLTALHETSDSQFLISSTVPLKESDLLQDDGAQFSVGYETAEKMMHAFCRWGLAHFRYEKRRNRILITGSASINLAVTNAGEISVNPSSTLRGNLDAAQLRSACRTAVAFHKRKVDRLPAKFNLTLRNGHAVHGYPYAVARRPIATPFDFAVPGPHITNFLQVASRFRGKIAVEEDADRLILRDRDGQCCSWLMASDVLPDPTARFEAEDLSRLEFSTSRLQMATALLAAFTDEIEITTSHDEGGRHLILRGAFKGLPVTSRLPLMEEMTEGIDCKVKTEDLALACCSLINETLTIRATESGLIVQGLGQEAVAQFLLLRFATG